MTHLTVGFAIALALLGCSSTKEYAPVAINPIQVGVPNQQRLLSSSAQDAVSQAALKLQLSRYAGKSVRVEVVGVGATEADLLSYVRTQVEAAAMVAGLRVLPPERLITRAVLLADASGALGQPGQDARTGPIQSAPVNLPGIGAEPYPPRSDTTDATPPRLPAGTEPADLRLIAAVDWGGIDIRDKKYTPAWPLAGQIALGTVGATAIGIGAGDEEAAPIVIGAMMIAGAAIWFFAGPDHTAHTYTLAGRVRVTMHVLPQQRDLAGLSASGEGQSAVVVDSTKDDGYTVLMPIPPIK